LEKKRQTVGAGRKGEMKGKRGQGDKKVLQKQKKVKVGVKSVGKDLSKEHCPLRTGRGEPPMGREDRNHNA